MKGNKKDNRPNLPRMERIQLDAKNVKLRWIVVALLICLGTGAIGWGVYSALKIEPGWQTVEVASDLPTTGMDFVLRYDFSGTGGAAPNHLRALNQVYRQASEEAYTLFGSPEAGGLGKLGSSPNTPVTLEPKMYQALTLFDEETAPYLFLAPAMAEYERVFLCEDDGEAARFDPRKNPETKQWLAELAAFVSNPEHIRLELLGGNQAVLHVSQAYLTFAEENGLETFLELGWMKNAFAADYLAEQLQENGFTNGYLVSYDGFTRNLDNRELDYTQSVFERRGNELFAAGNLHYAGPMSFVFLRDYPIGEQDRWHYYAYENGDVLMSYLTPEDAMPKASISNLLGYSREKGCAQVLLELLPVFIQDQFHPEQFPEGTQAVWADQNGIHWTGPELKRLDSQEDLAYQIP